MPVKRCIAPPYNPSLVMKLELLVVSKKHLNGYRHTPLSTRYHVLCSKPFMKLHQPLSSFVKPNKLPTPLRPRGRRLLTPTLPPRTTTIVFVFDTLLSVEKTNAVVVRNYINQREGDG